MPIFLDIADRDFSSAFKSLLGAKREFDTDVDDAVTTIIEDVKARGDEAVIELTAKFDRINLTPETLAFSAAEMDAAIQEVPDVERHALELAAERIRAYHSRQVPKDELWQDDAGVQLGWRWTAVGIAGLYVPGGLASYPSSVLMNAIPAQVAGVGSLSICAPTPDGAVNPLVLLAARLAGVDQVYRIGGAQAIAAMAYGTKTIAPVDKITGPGNTFVAAAKRQVFGHVGIDMIAGPSEILVIADKNNNADWIAVDLLSQAEHDEVAQSIMITDDVGFASQVAQAVEKRLETLERRDIAGKSWRDFGAVIVVENLEQAAELSNQIAPEHLELCVEDPDKLSQKITNAGALFLGAYTPEAVGDYVGGPNHVLPTARSARFSSGLSALDFMKRTTIAKMTPEALASIGPAAETLARSEGLEAHGLTIRLRLDQLNRDNK